MSRLQRSMHKLSIILLGLGLSLGLLQLQACSVLTAGSTASVASQLVIQEATAAVIQHGCADTACYAANAEKVMALTTVLQSATVTTVLSTLENALNDQILKLKLTPQQLPPILALENALLNYLTPIVGDKIFNAAALAAVNTVAGWVGQEAALYAPSIAAQHGFVPKRYFRQVPR